MIITYTPDEGEKREWSFVPGKMISAEAEAIEKATGWTYREFGKKFLAGSMLAYRALVWVFLKREDPNLKFDKFSILYEEIDLDYDAHERAILREEIEANPDMDLEQRENLLRILGPAEVEIPKDATTSPSTTDMPIPTQRT